jgi:hypothetical protein
MRFSTAVLSSALCVFMISVQQGPAQVFVGGQANNGITFTNGVAVGSNPDAQSKAQTIRPNLATSNAAPAIGRSGIRPAIPGTNRPTLGVPNPQRGFTPAIGRQGAGTAIGQQGSGTAIGQQGSGTAIGEQGVGTAITPPNNGVVIGQPEPFSPPAPAAPGVGIPPAAGFGGNVPPRFSNPGVTNVGTVGVGAHPALAPPMPAGSQGHPSPSGPR